MKNLLQIVLVLLLSLTTTSCGDDYDEQAAQDALVSDIENSSLKAFWALQTEDTTLGEARVAFDEAVYDTFGDSGDRVVSSVRSFRHDFIESTLEATYAALPATSEDFSEDDLAIAKSRALLAITEVADDSGLMDRIWAYEVVAQGFSK